MSPLGFDHFASASTVPLSSRSWKVLLPLTMVDEFVTVMRTLIFLPTVPKLMPR